MRSGSSRRQSSGPSSVPSLGWENHPLSVDFWESPWSLTFKYLGYIRWTPPMMSPTVLLKNYFGKSLTSSIAVRCAEPEPALQKFCVLFLGTKQIMLLSTPGTQSKSCYIKLFRGLFQTSYLLKVYVIPCWAQKCLTVSSSLRRSGAIQDSFIRWTESSCSGNETGLTELHCTAAVCAGVM